MQSVLIRLIMMKIRIIPGMSYIVHFALIHDTAHILDGLQFRSHSDKTMEKVQLNMI